MKMKVSLKGQAIKRNNKRNFSAIWRVIRQVSSSFIKLSCLLAGLIIISLFFLAGYQYLLTSPYIKLEKVIITGVDEKTKKELIEMAGLSPDLTLLAINLNELKQRMEKHVWVRSVELEKHFPHTLAIRVENEEPWAVVVMDRLFYMDRWGKIFKEVEPADKIDYPIVTGVSMDSLERELKLKLAARVLNSLENKRDGLSRADISEIHLKGTENVYLYFCSLPAVVKVRGKDLNKKLYELKKVVEHLKKSGRINMVKGINLHYRDGAVVSFKKGKAPKVS